MKNWDEDLAKIMEKKMKKYQEQIDNNTPTNNNHDKEISGPITLTDYNFDETTRKYSLLVVDFWAPWCGPCKLVSPMIDQLAIELRGKVVFGKLNVDENPTVANIFGIQSIPTLIIFRNGEAIDGLMGAIPKQQLISTISRYF
ncbi:MAG: thioredoxin [Nitrososphaerales archaeon]